MRISLIRCIQEPELADYEEEDRGEYPDGDRFVGGAFPLALRQYVRNKERHRERQIPQRLRPSEGLYYQQHLDIRDDSRDRRQGVKPRSSEELVGDKRGRVDEYNGDYEQ